METKVETSKVVTGNAERMTAYKGRMRAAGFRRLSVWVHPDLAAYLEAERRPHECGGRALERLVLGDARKRPGVSGK